MNRLKSVVIIPARGGSKRVPHKNVKLFAGKPMIAHSILAAQESGVADRIVVSTDSEEIAEVASRFGAEAPFMRPLELADDYAVTSAVILHALDKLEAAGYKADVVCCLYATAPLVRASHIREGFNLLHEAGVSSAVAVAKFPFPIWRALRINERGTVERVWPEHRNARSQDLPETYQDAGQFYWARVSAYREQRSFLGPACRPIILPRYLVQDIDTPEDWTLAELMHDVLEKCVAAKECDK